MASAIDRFEATFERLNQALAACAAVSVALFTVLIPVDMMLRKLGWGSLSWLNEGAEYGLYTGVFLTAAWVLHQGAHVRVDLVLTLLPKQASLMLERGIDLAGALLCAVFFYYGVRGSMIEYAFGTLPDKDLQIPNWIMVSVFAISFALLAIEFLLRFHRAGRGEIVVSDSGF